MSSGTNRAPYFDGEAYEPDLDYPLDNLAKSTRMRCSLPVVSVSLPVGTEVV